MPDTFANHAGTTLSGAIASATRPVTFSVASATGLPATGNFRVVIDSEILLITTIAGTSLTGSNAEGTTAATHSNGAAVTHVLTAASVLSLTPVTGSATLNFGATPGTNQVSVAVTGQTTIVAGSTASAFLMYDSTATHNIEEHSIVPMRLVCGTIVAGVGFTIYAFSEWRLTGTFTVRWSWS